MQSGLGLSHAEMAQVFADWNKGDLDSYLIEITEKIMRFNDEDGTPMVEKIVDKAGQKGTGKWTVISCLDVGIPVTLIGEAVFSRCLSSLKSERLAASTILPGPTCNGKYAGDKAVFIENVRQALYMSKIVSYAQGFMLMREAAKEHGWTLNYGGIALMWRGGCIIRSKFLGKIKDAFTNNAQLQNLLMDDFFKKVVTDCQGGLRATVSAAVGMGIPTPAFCTALSFYDGYRCARLPANLLQAQRDFFGAHTYERTDRAEGQFFHSNWTGTGGTTSSSTYNV